jgi:hypothetical protein
MLFCVEPKCLGFKTPKEVHDKIVENYLKNQSVAFAA